MYICGDHVFGN